MNTVFLLDDNLARSQCISNALYQEDFNVFRMKSENQCEFEVRRLMPVAIVAAVRPGGRSVTELLEAIAVKRDVPIILFSERDDESEELDALRSGASEFLRGAPSGALVAARTLHMLRHHVKQHDVFPGDERRIIREGNVDVDLDSYSVRCKGQEVALTCKEMDLLVSLLRRPGVVKSRQQLLDEVYASDVYVEDRAIDSFIKRLRGKIRAIDPGFDGIQTVYGVGYRYRKAEAEPIAGKTPLRPIPLSQLRADGPAWHLSKVGDTPKAIDHCMIA